MKDHKLFTSMFKVQYAKEAGFAPIPKKYGLSDLSMMDMLPTKSSHSVKKRVRNLEYDKEGTVEEDLSTQYTVNYDDGTFGFLIKRDKGATWKEIDDDTSTSE